MIRNSADFSTDTSVFTNHTLQATCVWMLLDIVVGEFSVVVILPDGQSKTSKCVCIFALALSLIKTHLLPL